MAAQKKEGQQARLSEHVCEEIDTWLARYPENQRRSAVLAALRAVQHEEGYLSVPMMDAVAEYLRIPAMEVYEAGSF